MHEITTKIYSEVAERLTESIRNCNFFSGSVYYTDHDTEYQLVCTIIIRRSKEFTEQGVIEVIRRIIPVWWEFHSLEGGTELCNDFDFGHLASLIEQQ